MKYLKSFNESYVRTEDDPELDEKFEEVITLLERDCKPFLDEVKSKHIGPLFRGARPYTNEEVDDLDIYKKEARIDRKPLDTNQAVSKLFDDIFEKKFGVRPRSNGIFTTKDSVATSGYGIRYMFFPIGEYEYYWNPKCNDLFIALREKTWYKRFTSIKPDTIKAPEPYQPNILKRLYYYITKNNLQDEVYKSLSSLVKDYTKSNLDENTKQEINFICKGYYLVDMRYYYKYMEYLGMNP